jgi:hypothetical protein
VHFITSKHPETDELGFFTLIDEPLVPGRHQLSIRLSEDAAKHLYPRFDRLYGAWANIPFFFTEKN